MRPVASVLSGCLLCACGYVPPVEPPPLRRAEAKPAAAEQWQTIGVSVQGRPIRHRSFGTGFRRVLFIGGIHGNEVEGMVATRELPRAFMARPGLSSQVTLHVVEDMNPDGRHSRRRTNARGVDLNRDFPARNRRASQGAGLSQPESQAMHRLILDLQPDLIIVAHSWRNRYFINYDGPGRGAARTFARHSGFPVVPSSNIAATPGSLGSWCGWDLSIPILTLEWQRGTPPSRAWDATREALLAVIRGAEVD